MMFSVMSTASAYETNQTTVTYSLQNNPSSVSDDFLTSPAVHSDNYIKAVEKVAEGVRNFENEIDISEFGIELDEFKDTFLQALRFTHPELINISNRINYYYNSGSGTVMTACPQYLFDKEESEKYFVPFNALVDSIVEEAEKLDSDFLKALYVHDFIATNAEYSYTVSDPNTVPEGFEYTAYGNLIDKHSVCQGYTMAYAVVLNRLGIENGYAVSETMNHIWNTVTLDGKTYHVDVTFDDPLDDIIGKVRHDSFLCTDEEITSAGHSDWVTDDEITQESYPDRFWDGINSKILIVDGYLYYSAYNSSDYSYIEKRSASDNTAEKFESKLTGQRWTIADNPNGYFPGNYSRLEYVGGRIYYSTPTGINSILPDGTDDRIEYTLTNAASTRLYGFAYSDGVFYGETAQTPNEDGEIFTIDITLPEPVLIYGDVSGDGKVDLQDAIMIQKSIISVIRLTEEQSLLADVTVDNHVGLEDVIIIQKYTASIKVKYDVGKAYIKPAEV